MILEKRRLKIRKKSESFVALYYDFVVSLEITAQRFDGTAYRVEATVGALLF